MNSRFSLEVLSKYPTLKGPFVDVVQGSQEWLKLRESKITSSIISQLFKYLSGKSTDSKVLASLVFKNKHEEPNNAMKHGTFYEPIAKKYFEQKNGNKVHDIGMVEPLNNYPGHGWLTASPDGFVIERDAVIEFKNLYTRPAGTGPLIDHIVQAMFTAYILGCKNYCIVETRFCDKYLPSDSTCEVLETSEIDDRKWELIYYKETWGVVDNEIIMMIWSYLNMTAELFNLKPKAVLGKRKSISVSTLPHLNNFNSDTYKGREILTINDIAPYLFNDPFLFLARYSTPTLFPEIFNHADITPPLYKIGTQYNSWTEQDGEELRDVLNVTNWWPNNISTIGNITNEESIVHALEETRKIFQASNELYRGTRRLISKPVFRSRSCNHVVIQPDFLLIDEAEKLTAFFVVKSKSCLTEKNNISLAFKHRKFIAQIKETFGNTHRFLLNSIDTCKLVVSRSLQNNINKKRTNDEFVPMIIDINKKYLNRCKVPEISVAYNFVNNVLMEKINDPTWDWKQDPLFLPNMCNNLDNNLWGEAKSFWAKELDEVSQIWYCSNETRRKLHERNLYSLKNVSAVDIVKQTSSLYTNIKNILEAQKDGVAVTISPRCGNDLSCSESDVELIEDSNSSIIQNFVIQDLDRLLPFYVDIETNLNSLNPYLIGCYSLDESMELYYWYVMGQDCQDVYKEFSKIVRKNVKNIEEITGISKMPVIIHWGSIEERIFNNMEESIKFKGLPCNTDFIDLYEVYKKLCVGINGTLTFSIKNVMNAISNLYNIPLLWPTEEETRPFSGNKGEDATSLIPNDALDKYLSDGMVLRKQDVLINYNKADCNALVYCLDFITTIDYLCMKKNLNAETVIITRQDLPELKRFTF